MAFGDKFRIWWWGIEMLCAVAVGFTGFGLGAEKYSSSANEEILAIFFFGFTSAFAALYNVCVVVYRKFFERKYSLETTGYYFDQERVRTAYMLGGAIVLSVIEFQDPYNYHGNSSEIHWFTFCWTIILLVYYSCYMIIDGLLTILLSCNRESGKNSFFYGIEDNSRFDRSDRTRNSDNTWDIVHNSILWTDWFASSILAILAVVWAGTFLSTRYNNEVIAVFYTGLAILVVNIFSVSTVVWGYLQYGKSPHYSFESNGDYYDQEPLRQVIIMTATIILNIVEFNDVYDYHGDTDNFHWYAFVWAIMLIVFYGLMWVSGFIGWIIRLISEDGMLMQVFFGHRVFKSNVYIATENTYSTGNGPVKYSA